MHRHAATLIVGFAAMLVAHTTSCSRGSNPAGEPPTTLSGQPIKVGAYTSAQVEELRAKPAAIKFPAPEGTVGRLVLPAVEPIPVSHTDWMPDRENKGRIGGLVVEYWLNADRILRVATAYYRENERFVNREQWAVILNRVERDHDFRPVY